MLPPRLMFNFHLQMVELIVPKQIEKFADTSEAIRPQPIEPLRALAPFRQQPSFGEDAQMLRNRRARRFEMFRNLAGRELPSVDQLKYRDPVWLSQSLQYHIGLTQEIFSSLSHRLLYTFSTRFR
jgi:hypothetical protein